MHAAANHGAEAERPREQYVIHSPWALWAVCSFEQSVSGASEIHFCASCRLSIVSASLSLACSISSVPLFSHLTLFDCLHPPFLPMAETIERWSNHHRKTLTESPRPTNAGKPPPPRLRFVPQGSLFTSLPLFASSNTVGSAEREEDQGRATEGSTRDPEGRRRKRSSSKRLSKRSSSLDPYPDAAVVDTDAKAHRLIFASAQPGFAGLQQDSPRHPFWQSQVTR